TRPEGLCTNRLTRVAPPPPGRWGVGGGGAGSTDPGRTRPRPARGARAARPPLRPRRPDGLHRGDGPAAPPAPRDALVPLPDRGRPGQYALRHRAARRRLPREPVPGAPRHPRGDLPRAGGAVRGVGGVWSGAELPALPRGAAPDGRRRVDRVPGDL